MLCQLILLPIDKLCELSRTPKPRKPTEHHEQETGGKQILFNVINIIYQTVIPVGIIKE